MKLLILCLFFVAWTQTSFAFVGITTESQVVSFFDTQTKQVLHTINDGGTVERGVAITPDGLKAVVANSSGSVSILDMKTQEIIAVIPVTIPNDQPFQVAITPDNLFAFISIGNRNRIYVIDLTSYTVATIITTANSPQGLAVTPNGNKLFVANGLSNLVSVYDAHTYALLMTIAAAGFPEDVAITPDGTKVLVSTFNSGVVYIIDPNTYAILNTVVGFPSSRLQGIAITSDSSKAYVANADTGTQVSVVDIGSATVTSNITVGSDPRYIALTPDNVSAYVTLTNEFRLAIIDVATDSLSGYLEGLPQNPFDVAIEPNANIPSFPTDLILSGFQEKNVFLQKTSRTNIINISVVPGDLAPVAFKIFRDAALTMLIGTIPASCHSFADPGRLPNQCCTYFVVAVDQFGNFTPPVSITICSR